MKNKIKYINIVVLMFIVVFIWGNSILNNTQSHQISNAITNKFINIVNYLFGIDIHYKIADLLIRKTAHFTQFYVLGFFSRFSLKLKSKYLAIIGFLIAVADELIQSSSPGRTPSFIDVCIDTSGFLFGIFCCVLLLKLCCRVSKRTNN